MPTKKTTRKTRKSTPDKVEKPNHTVYLPEAYNGPAFQLEGGRTLFVGRWLIMSQWAVLYLLPNGDRERFGSPELPVVQDKRIAISKLIQYALKKRLVKVQ